MHKKHGVLLPFGGHIELNETAYGAVEHELREESGYSLQQLTILQPTERIRNLEGIVVHPQPVLVNTHSVSDTHYHSDLAYAFVATEDAAGTPEDGESADIRWINRDDLLKLGSKEIYNNTRQVYLHILDVSLSNWEQVPADSFNTTSAP